MMYSQSVRPLQEKRFVDLFFVIILFLMNALAVEIKAHGWEKKCHRNLIISMESPMIIDSTIYNSFAQIVMRLHQRIVGEINVFIRVNSKFRQEQQFSIAPFFDSLNQTVYFDYAPLPQLAEGIG